MQVFSDFSALFGAHRVQWWSENWSWKSPSFKYLAKTPELEGALNGNLRVIAYAREARYPAHKLEFLALKWAITEKFHDYLYGNSFTVITDNNPLTYLLTTAKLDAVSYRWLAALSTFTLNI